MEEQSNAEYIYRGGTTTYHDIRGVRTVVVDANVTSISDEAFWNCSDLRYIRIPDTVTAIGMYVFRGCTSLTSVSLPPSLTTIGYRVFMGCTSLTSVSLPSSLTTIYGSAFENCTSLTRMTLPSSITAIHSTVFEGCTSLVSVTLAPSIPSIGMASTSSTTTLDKNPGWFNKFLVEAGFSRENPNNILIGLKTDRFSEAICMYYDLKTWAQTIGADSQLPLFTAARRSLKWYYTEQIFTANMPVVNEIDVLSGLPLSLLAAAGPASDLETVYNLMREAPGQIRLNGS